MREREAMRCIEHCDGTRSLGLGDAANGAICRIVFIWGAAAFVGQSSPSRVTSRFS